MSRPNPDIQKALKIVCNFVSKLCNASDAKGDWDEDVPKGNKLDVPRALIRPWIMKQKKYTFTEERTDVARKILKILDNSNIELLNNAALGHMDFVRIHKLNKTARWGSALEGKTYDMYRFRREPGGGFNIVPRDDDDHEQEMDACEGEGASAPRHRHTRDHTGVRRKMRDEPDEVLRVKKRSKSGKVIESGDMAANPVRRKKSPSKPADESDDELFRKFEAQLNSL